MDWGVLQGLGAGLQTIGGWKMEQDAETRRNKLALQLEEDREKRALKRYDPERDRPIKNAEGVWVKVRYTKGGDEMDRIPLTAEEIKEIEAGQKKTENSARLLDLQISKAERDNTQSAGLADFINNLSPEDRTLYYKRQTGLAPDADTVYTTDGAIARTLASRSGSADTESEESMSANDAIRGMMKDEISKYTQGKGALTPLEVEEAIATVNESAFGAYAKNRNTGTNRATPEQIRMLVLKELDRRYKAKLAAAGIEEEPVSVNLATGQG